MIRRVLLVISFLVASTLTVTAQTQVEFEPLASWIAQVVRNADANQDPHQALTSLHAAQAELDRIVASFPASRAAVRIVLGDPAIRQLKLAIPRTEERLRRWEVEFAAKLRQDLGQLEHDVAAASVTTDDAAWQNLARRAQMLVQDLQHPRAPAIDTDPLSVVDDRALNLAREQVAAGNYVAARTWADRVVRHYPEADAIRNTAIYELALADAELALREERWSDATNFAQQGLAARPNDTRLTLARDRAEVERLRREIQDATAREHWEPVERLMQQLLAIQRVPRSPPLLDEAAVAELAALARHAQVETALSKANTALGTGGLDRAVESVEVLQRIAADDPRLTTLIEQIDRQLLGQGGYFGSRFREVARVKVHQGAVTQLYPLSTGRGLVSVGADGMVVHDLNLQPLWREDKWVGWEMSFTDDPAGCFLMIDVRERRNRTTELRTLHNGKQAASLASALWSLDPLTGLAFSVRQKSRGSFTYQFSEPVSGTLQVVAEGEIDRVGESYEFSRNGKRLLGWSGGIQWTVLERTDKYRFGMSKSVRLRYDFLSGAKAQVSHDGARVAIIYGTSEGGKRVDFHSLLDGSRIGTADLGGRRLSLSADLETAAIVRQGRFKGFYPSDTDQAYEGTRQIAIMSMPGGRILREVELRAIGTSLAFGPNGRTLFVGDETGHVSIWDVIPFRAQPLRLQSSSTPDAMCGSAGRVESAALVRDEAAHAPADLPAKPTPVPPLMTATSRNELSGLDRYDGYNGIVADSAAGLVLVGAQDAERTGDSVVRLRRLGPDRVATADRTFLPEGAASAGLVDVVRVAENEYVAVGWQRLSGAEADDCWAVRFDPDGRELWSRRLGGRTHERCYFVELLPNGDLLVGGRSEDDASGKGAAQGVTWRLDPVSGTARAESYTLAGCDKCRRSAFQDAAAFPDGSILLVGWATDPGRGDDDAWIVKRDPSGRPSWEKRISVAGADLASSVVAGPAGEAIVVGYTTRTGEEATSGLLLKLRGDGSVVWQHEIGRGTGGNDRLYDGVLWPDGSLVAVGMTSETAEAPLKGWVLSVTGDGKIMENRQLDDPPRGRLLSVAQIGNGRLAAVGAARGSDRSDFDGWIAWLGGPPVDDPAISSRAEQR